MYENHHEPLLPRRKFYLRLLNTTLIGLIAILTALLIGMIGYHFFEEMTWVDAFANAAMILSGMGPLQPLKSIGGKIFAGFYALFSGLAFIVIIGVIFSPIVHRFFHYYHLDTKMK